MRYISRSGYEAYTSCERRYYYGYLFGKSGVTPPLPEEYFGIGLAVHKGMETFFRGGDTEACVTAARDEFDVQMQLAYEIGKKEQNGPLLAQLAHWKALSEGLIRGWIRSQSSKFLASFEPLMVEEECELPLANGLTLQTRADLVVRSRMTGNVYVVNWKTEGSTKDPGKFFNKYCRNIQMWTEALAVEKKIGEPCSVLPVGFYKGSKNRGYYSSPLVWGYERDGAWTAKYPGWNTHFRKVAIWEEETYELPTGEKGLGAWIDWLPMDTVDAQFIDCPPIQKDEKVVEDWLRQVVQRERDLEHMLDPAVPEKDRELYFFQRFGSHCIWCPFDPICTQLTTTEEMVKDGLLVPRVDHHAVGGDNE